jgi:hypothetical protein
MCGFSYAAAGKPTSMQTAGDCHTNECDGAGNVTSVVDDGDVPASSNQCTFGVCTAGTASMDPEPVTTPCTQGGGVECDGAGTCVECVAATDCPGTDTDCRKRTCTTGKCGVDDVASGTPTSTQTPGDCHTNECDGSGNIVSVVDDGDVPASSSTCAPGVCTAGSPSIGKATQGTACAQSGGVLCDGQGSCTQTVTVVVVGPGSAGALNGTAAPVALQTYYPLAASSAVGSVALPQTASGANQPLLIGGSSITEGGLSRSGDGHYVVLAGYSVALGGTTTTTGVARIVGRVGATGPADTTTILPATAFAGASVRGAAAATGDDFWVSGTSSSSTAGGVWYLPHGAMGGATGAGTQVVTAPNNMRQVAVFAGALYGDSGSGAFTGVDSFSPLLPTAAGGTAAILPNMTTTNPGGFVLLDLDPTVSGVDTLFVADSGSTAGLERWTFDGTNWTKDTTFTVLTAGCLGVAGWSNGNGATLVAAMSAGTLQRVDVPTTGAPTATLIATAATDTAFRGVALAPH